MTINRNLLYLGIGALGVVAAVLGYQLYQERQSSGIEIEVDESGISIEQKQPRQIASHKQSRTAPRAPRDAAEHFCVVDLSLASRTP